MRVHVSEKIVHLYIDGISSCYSNDVNMRELRAVLLTVKCVGAVTFG